MDKYTESLEKLITDELLPVYLLHHRLLGLEPPTKQINKKLLEAAKNKKKVPRLLERECYGK